MKLSLVTIAVLAGALQASAQTFIGPTSDTHAGSGCPQGSSVPVAVSSSSVTYTPPSTFVASVTPITSSRVNCQIALGGGSGSPRLRPPVTTFTPAGNSESVTNTYFFPGSSATSTGVTTLTSLGSTSVTNTYSPATNWSPCGGCFIFNINTALRAIGSDPSGSISIGGTITTPVVWEACTA
ncbi:putative secreted protein [Coprinopsis sp. MPI-PUGE-AT-0042]|nr:putative secreted protein [Coprinopsis sp. MPI-PUGE-AT-0042]